MSRPAAAAAGVAPSPAADVSSSPAVVDVPADAAPLPSPAAFARLQHDFRMSLAPYKGAKALADTPTNAVIRDVLCDADLASGSAFRFWARETFRLDDDMEHILREDRRVAHTEDLHAILCAAHTACAHRARDATLKEIREPWRPVPKDLVARFVEECPTCMLKITPTTTRGAGADVESVEPLNTPSARTHVPAVPRLLISPVCSHPERLIPSASPLALPLGSPTTEILAGLTPPRCAMQLAPSFAATLERPGAIGLDANPGHIPSSCACSAGPHKSSEIPIDPSLSPYPALVLPPRSSAAKRSDTAPFAASPPLVVDNAMLALSANTTPMPPPSGPPPRPPRSPLRPPPTRISSTVRAKPPGPIDVRAANACMPLCCDVTSTGTTYADTSTPTISSAYKSTASGPSQPSTPPSTPPSGDPRHAYKGNFLRSLSGAGRTSTDVEDASRDELLPIASDKRESRVGSKRATRLSAPSVSRVSSTSTEHATCDEISVALGDRHEKRAPRVRKLALPHASASASANADTASSTPRSATSMWSQDSAPSSACIWDSDGRGEHEDDGAKGNGARDEDPYDGDAELEDGELLDGQDSFLT